MYVYTHIYIYMYTYVYIYMAHPELNSSKETFEANDIHDDRCSSLYI
jgi:hypothetical protein